MDIDTQHGLEKLALFVVLVAVVLVRPVQVQQVQKAINDVAPIVSVLK